MSATLDFNLYVKQTMNPLLFWKNVAIHGDCECWDWKRSKQSSGYGVISIYRPEDKFKTTFGSHRVAWILTHGAIPTGMQVCHKCDNPLCCNPNHLFLGTKGDNIRDAVSKGRALIGSLNGNARYTESDVIRIRLKYKENPKGALARLAKEFKTTNDSIWKIVRRRSWKHLN